MSCSREAMPNHIQIGGFGKDEGNVFEGARDELALRVDGEKSWVSVNVFVAGHGLVLPSESRCTILPKSGLRDKMLGDFFYNFVRATFGAHPANFFFCNISSSVHMGCNGY